jgi:hypothetical protein
MQAAQASDNAFLSNTRLPHWSWGPPGRYYGRAGYRDDFGGGSSTSERALHPRRHICNTACAGWLTVHARRHQREVCPLSRGVMLQPLSAPLQHGIRFLPPPLPAAPSARLAVRFPSTPLVYGAGETTGLPRSADVPEWIGRICTPVARHLRRRSSGPPDLATYLLVQAVQQLALVLCDDAYDALPGLAIPLNPSPQPPLLLAVAVTARALAALPKEKDTLSWRLLAGRILLAEQGSSQTEPKTMSNNWTVRG